MKSTYRIIKKSFYILGVAAGLLVGSQSLQAGMSITNYTLTAGISTNLLASTNWFISSIQVNTGTLPTGTNAIVRFYDLDQTNSLTYTNAAYTNYVTVKTNVTSIITNSFGDLQTNIYPGQWTTAETVVANTNAAPVIASFTLGANSASTQTRNIVTGKGLVAKVATDVTNVTVTVTYSTSP